MILTALVVVFAAIAIAAFVVLAYWSIALFRSTIATARTAAEADRQQTLLLLDVLSRLDAKLVRIEAGAEGDRLIVRGVASDLVLAQSAVDGIADRDTAARSRADEVASSAPHEAGAVADAYSRSPEDP